MQDIIISDHSEDRSGTMADICRLKSGLQQPDDRSPLFLHFPGLPELDLVCNTDLKTGYDIFHWNHPIVLGCITSNQMDTDCSGNSSTNHFQRIYLIKPALPSSNSQHTLGETLAKVEAQCQNGIEKKNCQEAIQDKCRQIMAGEPYTPKGIVATGHS